MKQVIRTAFWLVATTTLVLLSGCGFMNSERPVPKRWAELRGPARPSHEVQVVLSRDEYRRAVEDLQSLSAMRMVQILEPGQTDDLAPPQYRLFNVLPGSAFDMIGLKNTDILVAANDYILYDPQRFTTFMQLIAEEDEASIEIRRGAQPMLFSIHLVD